MLLVEVEGQEGEENGTDQMGIRVDGLIVQIQQTAERDPRRIRCWPMRTLNQRLCRVFGPGN